MFRYSNLSRALAISFIFIFILSTGFPHVSQAFKVPSFGENGSLWNWIGSSSTERSERAPRVESAETPEVIHGRVPSVESGDEAEVKRDRELLWEGRTEVLAPEEDTDMHTEMRMMSVTEAGLGENLVKNPDIESANTAGAPLSWFKGGYGTNTRVLSYVSTGVGGSKALQVEISAYTSGDAKWYSAEIPVTPQSTYRFSNYVRSTVPSYVTLRFKTSSGSYIYKDLFRTEATSSFTETGTEFTVPSGVVSLSIFHLIKEKGVLVTDDYALQEVLPETDSENLIKNPSFITDSGSGRPASWFKGGYGNNTRTLTYPVAGRTDSRAVEARITNYVSGDAKWYHEKVSVSPGLYTFTDFYRSTVPSTLTAQFQRSDGTLSYLDVARLSAAASFTELVADFVVPSGVVSVTMFHAIKGNGTLTIDDVGLYKKTDVPTVFDSGAVSFTFDDGWREHHDVAMQKLNEAGLKGTFYVISRQLTENGFPGFMTHAQVKNIFNNGHEIGSHTRTHKALTTLTSEQQRAEIEGSQTDLESMGVGPITTFAYPFGDYNASVLALVKGTPYDAARATINGNATPSSDLYQLPRFSVEVNTTLESMKVAVDQAIKNKQWIIFAVHRIDASGERYSVLPETLRALIDYVDTKNVRVTTIASGIKDM